MQHFFTEQDVKDFNAPLAKLSKELTKGNRPKVRYSAEIKAEMDRQNLGLRAAREFLQRSEDALADAARRLKAANDRLAALKESGAYNPGRAEVQRLIGFSRHNKVLDKAEFHPGVVQRCEEVIAAETRRIPVRKDVVKREEARLGAVLRGLQSELEEAYKIEGALDGTVRQGNLIRKI